MKEFALLFRRPDFDLSKISPKEMQELAKKWDNWAAGITEQGKLVSRGARLNPEGKVLKGGGVITDGPYVEVREILGGFVIIKAEDLEEATTLAHGCPILDTGGSVEVRPIFVD